MSACAMHAICHRRDGRPTNFRNISPKEGVYGSGWWMVERSVADTLVGGWLYLHESSAQRSHFVGRIEGISDTNADGCIEFVVRKQRVNDQPWRGGTPGQHPKHYFKIVPVSFQHEQGETNGQ